MDIDPRQPTGTQGSEQAALQQPGRRTFLIAAVSAIGTAALRLMHRGSLTAVEAYAADPGLVTIIAFSAHGKPSGKTTVPRVIKTEQQWQQQLSPISFEVTRHAGTERAYTGATWNLHDHGLYRCICCGNALFSSAAKFESGTGWPSFWQPLAKQNIVETHDASFGMERVAVSCRECDAHLGHVFDDGPPPTGLRYCMNSAAMRFVKTA